MPVSSVTNIFYRFHHLKFEARLIGSYWLIKYSYTNEIIIGDYIIILKF